MAKGIGNDSAQVGIARRGLSQTVNGKSSPLPLGKCKITPTADARIVQHPDSESPIPDATDEFFVGGVIQFIMIERDGNCLTTDVDVYVTPYQ